jgi:adenylate cyclase class IV
VPANVEIKARVRDAEHLYRLVMALSDTPASSLDQDDTFFYTPRGRLKLRTCSPTSGELIYYERADTRDPKPSYYTIAGTREPLALQDVLTAALGVCGRVRKQRRLFLIGQTRVHLDTVEGLGTFVELEWVMRPGQTVEAGRQVVIGLMQQLEIAATDLVSAAYVDLLSAPPDASITG